MDRAPLSRTDNTTHMRSCLALVVVLCAVHAALVASHRAPPPPADDTTPTDCAIVLSDLAVLPSDPRFAAVARINNPLYNASAPAFVAQARLRRWGGCGQL